MKQRLGNWGKSGVEPQRLFQLTSRVESKMVSAFAFIRRMIALLILVTVLKISAATLTPSSGAVNTAIPDNDTNGITSVINVSGATQNITDLTITINRSASGQRRYSRHGDGGLGSFTPGVFFWGQIFF